MFVTENMKYRSNFTKNENYMGKAENTTYHKNVRFCGKGYTVFSMPSKSSGTESI